MWTTNAIESWAKMPNKVGKWSLLDWWSKSESFRGPGRLKVNYFDNQKLIRHNPSKSSCSVLTSLLPYQFNVIANEEVKLLNYRQCCGTRSECGEKFNISSSDSVIWRELNNFPFVCFPPDLNDEIMSPAGVCKKIHCFNIQKVAFLWFVVSLPIPGFRTWPPK